MSGPTGRSALMSLLTSYLRIVEEFIARGIFVERLQVVGLGLRDFMALQTLRFIRYMERLINVGGIDFVLHTQLDMELFDGAL